MRREKNRQQIKIISTYNRLGCFLELIVYIVRMRAWYLHSFKLSLICINDALYLAPTLLLWLHFFGLFFRLLFLHLLFTSIELIVECVRTRDITILYFHFSRNSFCSVCFWLFLPCFDWKWGALTFKIISLFHKDSKANEYTTLKKKRTNLFFFIRLLCWFFFFQKYFRRVCNSIASHKWYEHLAALHCLFNPEMHIPIDDDDDVCVSFSLLLA